MKNPVALIDLDGTLADFDGAMRGELLAISDSSLKFEALEESLHHDAENKLPHIAAQRALIKGKPGFWRGLREIPLGFRIVDALRVEGFRIHVCTRASKKLPQCWAEKVQWCSAAGEGLGVAGLALTGAGITITTDKTLVYGDVLLDDWPGYFEPWLEAHPHGQVLVPAQPWNEGHGTEWGERVSAMDELRIRTGIQIIRVTDATPLPQLAELLMKKHQRSL